MFPLSREELSAGTGLIVAERADACRHRQVALTPAEMLDGNAKRAAKRLLMLSEGEDGVRADVANRAAGTRYDPQGQTEDVIGNCRWRQEDDATTMVHFRKYEPIFDFQSRNDSGPAASDEFHPSRMR